MIGETSILNFNKDLYKKVSYKGLPNFISVNVANYFAKDALDWTKYFINWSSGTHMAEWFIFD